MLIKGTAQQEILIFEYISPKINIYKLNKMFDDLYKKNATFKIKGNNLYLYISYELACNKVEEFDKMIASHNELNKNRALKILIEENLHENPTIRTSAI